LKKLRNVLCIACVLISVVTVFYAIPVKEQVYHGPDEYSYHIYSRFLLEHGMQGFPGLLKEFISHKDRWIWPSPLRAGYLFLSTVSFRMLGPFFSSLAYLSWISFVVTLLITFYFSRKLFGGDFAGLCTLLYAFSPLQMAMAKRALSDSLGNLFIVLAIWLFLDFLMKPSSMKLAFFTAAYAYALLIKETALLYAVFFAVAYGVFVFKRNSDTSVRKALVATAIAVGIAVTVLLLVFQNPADIMQVIKIQQAMPSLNQYSVLFCRGPWFRYLIDYMLLSPVVTLLSLAFAVLVWLRTDARKEFPVLYFVVAFVLAYCLFSMLPFAKNVRYAMSLDLPMRLMAVWMLAEIVKIRKIPYVSDPLFMGVLCLCALDYLNFVQLFCRADLYDPISMVLLQVRLFIP
jgi:4-amino-4-deoxy-L-arabinose transferase-like glycosyltransferase